MELKVGKDRDVKRDLLLDVAEIKSDIRHNRNVVDILKDEYKKATTNEERRTIGIEINSINSQISSLRKDLREVALDSAFNAQRLESEIDTARGELSKYLNIDQGKVDDVLKEFSGRYYDMHDARSEIKRKLETAVGGDERALQGELDVLHTAILQVGIVERNKMIEELLPDVKGIDSAEDVAEHVEEFSKEAMKAWFDNGDIKEESLEVIKYGKPLVVKYEPIPGTEKLERVTEERIVGVIEQNIEDRTNAINSIGGVWATVGDTDTPKGKHITFNTEELEELAKIKTPDEMIVAINSMCTTDQTNAFKDALGEVDKKGYILYSEGVVCNVADQEIRDAFDRKYELEEGVIGSGYEYMSMFLKRLLKYDAFSDDIYSEMSECDSIDDLLGMIRKEITGCSCVITDIHEDAVRMAFYDRLSLETDSKGKGVVFMNRALRNIFNCDTFEDHVYSDISECKDPGEMVGKINTELSNAGVYDRDVLDYAIEGIDRKATINNAAEKQLDDVFGDHFTKQEYKDAAQHVVSEKSVVASNRDSLIKRFRTIGKEGQILAGKTLEGISNDDYNARWDKERQKMIKHGETKNIDTIILKRQKDAAQKQFANLVSGIDDDSMSSREEIRYVFESVGLQQYVTNNLSASITDLDYVIEDNMQKLTRGMRSLIKKHDMYEDDIFSERRIHDAVEKREKLELGDRAGALDHMKDAIAKSVGKLDMTKYGTSIVDSMSEKINADYGDLDEESLVNMPEDDITIQFSRRIQRYKDDANASMKAAEETAIKDLYAGRSEEDNVDVPPEFSREDMQEKHLKELEKARKEAIKDVSDVPGRLAPFLSREEIGDYTDVIPKKPKVVKTEKGLKEMAWWETFMAKNEPVFDRTAAFNSANLALVMRKGTGKKYVVYGEGGKSAGFKTLKDLDKWFKSNYPTK